MTEPVAPGTITAPPTAPTRSMASAAFITAANAFIAWFSTFVTQITAEIAKVFTNATASKEKADIAVAAAAAAANSASAATTNGAIQVDLAEDQKDLAIIAAAAAAASASSALNAPGTQATSTTSRAIPTIPVTPVSKQFDIQTGKLFAVGMTMRVVDTADVANYMGGTVSAHDSVAGSITLSITEAGGTGTKASWRLFPNPLSGAAAGAGGYTTKTAAYVAVAGDRLNLDTTAGTFPVTLPAAPVEGDVVTLRTLPTAARIAPTVDPGSNTIEGQAGVMLFDLLSAALVYKASNWSFIR